MDNLTQEQKVALINGFNSIKGKVPKIKSTDQFVADAISNSFTSWVDGQINTLLGNTTPASPGNIIQPQFTEEQATALKVLAATVMKQNSTGTPIAPIQQRPAPRVNTNAKPLKEAVDLSQMDAFNKKILADLDKMDREGPEF